MNCFAILGIGDDANEDEIQKAFRKRAIETHPDSSGKDGSEFKMVMLAYERALKERNVDTSLLPNYFNFAKQGLDIVKVIKINPTEAKEGVVKELHFSRRIICNDCSGYGYKDFKTCDKCEGSGTGKKQTFAPFVVELPCEACAGMGFVPKTHCYHCNGSGFNGSENQVVYVKIEPGFSRGKFYLLKGKGHPGKDYDGDLIVKAYVEY